RSADQGQIRRPVRCRGAVPETVAKERAGQSPPFSSSYGRGGLAAVARAEGAQAKRVEPDEALSILLVVGAAVVLEGDEVVAVKRLQRTASGHDDVALVELQPDLSLDVLLGLVDERLQHLAFGR